MARRSDHNKAELQALIIKAARDIIETKGYEGLTARKIANAIGYAPGTIYNFFASMDELCITINAQTLDALYDALEAKRQTTNEKRNVDNLKNMAKAYGDFAKDQKHFWLMLFQHTLPEGQNAPDWLEAKIERLFTPIEILLAPYFPKDQQGTQPHKTATRILWSSVHSLYFLEATQKITLVGSQANTDIMASTLIETFTTGLKQS